jgi:3-methyladenine DNA glycosylase AlkC
MNILTEEIKNEIRKGIVRDILQKEYDKASDRIAAIVLELRASIPVEKRISYGVVHSIRVLSEFLFKQLAEAKVPAFEVASKIYAIADDHKAKAVALGMLTCHGLYEYQSVIPFFNSAASSSDWNMREISQMFFRKLIKVHPGEAREYLVRLSTSTDCHLRRFVAETLRPVSENGWLYGKPDYSIAILRRLFREKYREARTSVGNNLSDLARKLPDIVYTLVRELVESGDENSYWIAYRACRNLVKKEPERVMDLLRVNSYKYKTRVYHRTRNNGK